MNGIGRGSKDLEASEERRVAIRLERRDKVRQVQDMEESSCGVSHGRMRSAMAKKLGVTVESSASSSSSSYFRFEIGGLVLIAVTCECLRGLDGQTKEFHRMQDYLVLF